MRRANDTIAAIASPGGAAERGVIRVSGPRAQEIVSAVWRGAAPPDLARRSLAVGRFDDGSGEQPLLLLWMRGPHSFTREDVAEFHLPGHPELLQLALARLLALGARAAEPGEFTRRAFHSGRIDLTRAEGVLALVFAANEAEARAARALLFGGLESLVTAARAALVDVRTLTEASLDFDENDTGHVPTREIAVLMATAAATLSAALSFELQREAARGSARVVLAGAPNAGKSALFNALLDRDAALVSPHAGTTRDWLEAELDLAGTAALLVDTAGIDVGVQSGPDRTAQAFSAGARAGADLTLWVVDALRAEREELLAERERLVAASVLLVWHKTDLAPAPPPAWIAELKVAGVVPVSSRARRGLVELRAKILEHLSAGPGGVGRESAVRHAAALSQARTELEAARAALAQGLALELVAEHLRQATDELDQVSGRTAPEDVLDRIFARFCLGK